MSETPRTNILANVGCRSHITLGNIFTSQKIWKGEWLVNHLVKHVGSHDQILKTGAGSVGGVGRVWIVRYLKRKKLRAEGKSGTMSAHQNVSSKEFGRGIGGDNP